MELQVKNGTVLVDDADWEYLKDLNWYIDIRMGYAMTAIYMKFKKRTNQFKMEWFILGKPEKGYVIDHINGNKSDNQKENLRVVTIYQNNFNRFKHKHSKNTQYKGLHWEEKSQRWRVRLRFNKKEYLVGRFISEIDAAHAYDFKALELFGVMAKLNFPDFDYTNYKINRQTMKNQKPKTVSDGPKGLV